MGYTVAMKNAIERIQEALEDMIEEATDGLNHLIACQEQAEDQLKSDGNADPDWTEVDDVAHELVDLEHQVSRIRHCLATVTRDI